MAIHFLNEETVKLFENRDKLLFRVMPLDRVIEILNDEQWAFVSPTLWNDPFEKAFLEAEYNHSGKTFFLPIKPAKENNEVQYRLFSVCFTETPESEAFWKTYAPNGDGVRITVKASALKKALSGLRDYDVYIGKALYEDYDELYKFKKNAAFWRELKSGTINTTQLELMLKKRKPFEYENEIRILLLRKKPMKNSVAKVKIKNTKELIYAIKLDPRMGPYVAKMVKDAFKQWFPENKIRTSILYSKPESSITFKEDIHKPR